MLIADAATCGKKLAIWDRNLMEATYADSTRMGFFPLKCLNDHFQLISSSATDKDCIMNAIMQFVLCQVRMIRATLDEEDDDDEDEADSTHCHRSL